MLSSVSKSVYMSSASIDLERSKAYLSSFAGPKSYTHGGLEINREALGANDYESFRAELIHALSNLHHPDTGEDLMEWVCAREDLYSGSFASTCYPDVVFELAEGYGTYWGIHNGLIGDSHEHKLSSGGHRRDAVFLIKGLEEVSPNADMQLMDVSHLISRSLGVGANANA
jgi:predicted AlkP superfamily phosphohydrolase/phosphomutase